LKKLLISISFSSWFVRVLFHTWCLGRPTMDGKTARGASSPANPALHIPDPLSTTNAATSSSHIVIGFDGFYTPHKLELEIRTKTKIKAWIKIPACVRSVNLIWFAMILWFLSKCFHCLFTIQLKYSNEFVQLPKSSFMNS